MADLVYQVSLGKSRLYSFCVNSVKDWAKRMGADHIVQTEPTLKIRPDPRRNGRSTAAVEKFQCLPILEKLNAYSHFGQYDRIAIIDADVFVRPSAGSIFDLLGHADFAAVRERDTPSLPKHKKKLVGFSRNMFGPLQDVN